VETAGERLAQRYEAWIAADPFRGGVRVLIAGPQSLERTVTVARDEAPKRIVSPAARRRMVAAQKKRWAARALALARPPRPAFRQGPSKGPGHS
jgi:hypothetical protein